MLAVFTNVLCNADESTEYDLCYGILKHYILNILIYWFIHSKNVRIIISGSFENDPIWVKCASFNPFSGHSRVNFKRKCLTRNSGSKQKARWRCMKRARNRPRCICSKLFTVCELGLET